MEREVAHDGEVCVFVPWGPRNAVLPPPAEVVTPTGTCLALCTHLPAANITCSDAAYRILLVHCIIGSTNVCEMGANVK